MKEVSETYVFQKANPSSDEFKSFVESSKNDFEKTYPLHGSVVSSIVNSGHIKLKITKKYN